jgi:hypothetical protein
MFYSERMGATVQLVTNTRPEIDRLRAQVERAQGRKLEAPVLPVHPALARLLPGGGLRQGSAYVVSGSATLLSALMAEPSRAGSWCGVVGMPDFGAEAAEHLGVDLSRVVLVPDPGPRWLAVTATVAEVLPVVAVRPPARVSDGEVSRLSARLRDRGTVLLVQGPWPQAEATIQVSAPDWSGLDRGHGYLRSREVTVSVTGRRMPRPRHGRVLLPGPEGTVALPPTVTTVPISPAASVADFVPLEAVG